MKSAINWTLFPFQLHCFNTFKITGNTVFMLLIFHCNFSFMELSSLKISPEEPKYADEFKWKNCNLMSGIHLNYLIYNVCIDMILLVVKK